MQNIKIEETLYIKILVWAYRKQETGFTWNELLEKFKLNKDQESWVLRTFRGNLPASENLIDHLTYRDNDSHFYVITPKGISAAISYLSLKQAEEGSKRAERIAIAAIIIGSLVGVVQIILDLA